MQLPIKRVGSRTAGKSVGARRESGRGEAMNGRPWLTIITVTKDDPRGLARTLASAAEFRRAGAEHLVVDGSREPEVARRLAGESDPTVVCLHRSPEGVAKAFNAGLAEARGEWVWFLNGGDAAHETVDPFWLRTWLMATQAQVVAGTLHFDGEPQPRSQPRLAYQWPLIACWLGHPATLVRRELLIKGGGFDHRWTIAMDYDLWFRLLADGAVVDVVSVPFARFDINGISERKETRRRARREEATVVVKHTWQLIGAVVWLILRVLRRLVKAAICSMIGPRRER